MIVNWFRKNYLLILILALSATLRFWKLPELLHFTLDEELEAFIVKNIVTGFHYPAIGVSVAPVGLHLSPLFYYLVAIPFWIGSLNPVSWGVTASLMGVVTTLLLYLSTKVMFSKRIALIVSGLYSASFLMVLYDKHFWNVTFMPFLSVVVIYSLYQIINKKYWWAIPLFGALALGISSHLSSLSLVLLTILVFWRDKIPFWKKQFLLGGLVLFLSQVPLLIFELRHQFYQSQVLWKFLTGEHSGLNIQRIVDNISLLPKILSRLIYTFGPHDFSREHTYGLIEIVLRDERIPTFVFLIAVVMLFFFVLLVKNNYRNHAFKLHGALILVTIISLVVYGILFKGNLFEFYLNLLLPTLLLVCALSLDRLMSKGTIGTILSLSVLVVLLLLNTQAVFSSYHSFGLSKKLEVIDWVKTKVGVEPFELHSIGVNHKYEGYTYLFDKFYKAPVKSYVDPQLSWLYQAPIATVSPEIMVVITSTEENYQQDIDEERNTYLPFVVERKQFGKIDVMIVKGF